MLTPILVQMGMVECHIFKQLNQHNEQAEEIMARVRAKKSRPRSERPPRQTHDQSIKTEKKETLTVEAKHLQCLQAARGGGALTTSGSGLSNQTRSPNHHSFRDKHVNSLFKLLNKSNKLKILEPRRPQRSGKN